MQDKIITIEKAAKELLAGKKESACCIIQKEYPFKKYEVFHRTYTLKQKMNQFKSIGYEWNEDVCQDYQRHYPEGLGYQVLRPVRKLQ